MYQMMMEDLHDAFHSFYRAIAEEDELRWRLFFVRQAWWSLTCILYSHGAKERTTNV
jgi:hypothetical protein